MFDLTNLKTREALWAAGGIAFMVAFFVALMVLLSSCHHMPEPLPPMPDTCEAACANYSRLQCPEARPTKGGAMCPEVCHKAIRLVRFDLNCLANAADIDELRECGGVRCQW